MLHRFLAATRHPENSHYGRRAPSFKNPFQAAPAGQANTAVHRPCAGQLGQSPASTCAGCADPRCISDPPATIVIDYPTCNPDEVVCYMSVRLGKTITYYVTGRDVNPFDDASVTATSLPESGSRFLQAASSNPTPRLFSWKPRPVDLVANTVYGAQSRGEGVARKTVVSAMSVTAVPRREEDGRDAHRARGQDGGRRGQEGGRVGGQSGV